jgi:hypothetical protein
MFVSSPWLRGRALCARFKARATSAAVVATALLGAGALAATVPSVAQAATGTSTITGSVTVPSGADAANVGVTLVESGDNANSTSVTDTGSPSTTGTYTFTNVPAGTYQLYFSENTGTDNVAPEYYGGAQTEASATSISLASGATATANITLASGAEITGTVSGVDTDLNPQIEACAYNWNDAESGCVSSVTLPSDGSYTFAGLMPGVKYYLQYGSGAYYDSSTGSHGSILGYVDGGSVSARAEDESLFTASSGTAQTVNFAAPSLGSIQVTAKYPDGSADTNGGFSLYASDGSPIDDYDLYKVSDADGLTTIYGIIPGTYKLEFAPDSYYLADVYYGNASTIATAQTITVGSGQAVTGLTIQASQAATISGTITAARGGAPLGGLEVDAVDANGFSVGLAIANADGTYTISGVPAGSWHIEIVGGEAFGGTFYQTEYYGGKTTEAGSKAVTVAAGQNLTGINQAVMAQSLTLPGLAKLSRGAAKNEAKDKTALSFTLKSGSGVAGYLAAFRIKLPKQLSWNRKRVAKDVTIARVAVKTRVAGKYLYVTLPPTGVASASVKIKAGAISITKAARKAAKRRKLKAQTFNVVVTSTLGGSTGLKFTVKKPH